ncbi:MAG: glycoside hydrolase family 25 [Oscillospiraceae bacterium]|nr:glycoside hydrolase family 25 [Oscillospiraceae bacterium]
MQKRKIFCLIMLCCLLTGCAESDREIAEIPEIQESTEITETQEITETETIPEINPETSPETEVTESSIESTEVTESTTETTTESVTETIPEETIPPETIETLPVFPAPESVFFNTPEMLEAGQRIKLENFILDTNIILQDPGILVDTSQIGIFEIPVAYHYGTEIREQIITYEVSDTMPPVILNNGSGAFVRTGGEFNLRNLIGYGDAEDPSPSLTYDGDVDTSTPGIYPVTAYITDRSGNQSVCNLTVTVGDTTPNTNSTRPQMYFQDFISQYNDPGLGTVFGIDVSKWQGYIDYNAVKQAGCEFVLLRIGASYNNPPQMDEYYFYNIDSAKQAGLQVGVYFYTTDTTEEQIRADVAWIIENLDGRELDFPVVFDWEDFQHFQKYGISFYELNRLYQVFSEELRQSGYDAMLYGSKNYLENIWGMPSDCPVWLAHYTTQTNYAGNYQFWQRTDAGLMPGISVPVDFDIYYNSN